MSDSFDALEKSLDTGGVDQALEGLVQRLRDDERYNELFDARLMQARHRLGLPVGDMSLDELPEPVRSEAEASYLEACSEVGGLLMEAGRLRDAWLFLRPAAEKERLAEALVRVEPDEENLDELVEVALHEGVAPEHGFALVLEHYGTCNAITTFEGAAGRLPVEAQRAMASLLVRNLHAELLENVRSHLADMEDGAPDDASTLAKLVAARPGLFEGDSYHIDTSHLSSVIRFARLLDAGEPLALALDLTEYGRRLSSQFQTEGDEPFTDHYAHHALLFAATLGDRIEEAVAHFEDRARSVDAEREGTASIETYLILLARLGRHAEALEAADTLVPAGLALSPYAPRIVDLARASGAWDRYLDLCRRRDDPVGYAAGLVARGEADS